MLTYLPLRRLRLLPERWSSGLDHPLGLHLPRIGTASKIIVTGQSHRSDAVSTSFILSASSTGLWGDGLQYNLAEQDTQDLGTRADADIHSVFTLQILLDEHEGDGRGRGAVLRSVDHG